MTSFIDAYEKLRIAEDLHIKGKFADSIFNAQLVIELSLKSLMEVVGVDYKLKHTMSDNGISQLLKVIQKKFKDNRNASEDATIKIARSHLILNSLGCLRNYTQYGICGLSAKNIFMGVPMGELAKAFISSSREVYWELSTLAKFRM